MKDDIIVYWLHKVCPLQRSEKYFAIALLRVFIQHKLTSKKHFSKNWLVKFFALGKFIYWKPLNYFLHF